MTQDDILDAYENTARRGVCPGATHIAKVINPVCGDDIEITLRVENGKILEAWHLGHGCMLSLASAAMLCDAISGSEIPNLPSVKEWLAGFPVSARRKQCVALAVEAMRGALGW